MMKKIRVRECNESTNGTPGLQGGSQDDGHAPRSTVLTNQCPVKETNGERAEGIMNETATDI